jgi:N-acetyl-alpha-D-muramate 1-phosphate uridylyltransferase
MRRLTQANTAQGRGPQAAHRIRPKLDLQAAILAGGLGMRMRPLTETIPKAMIEVCGKPFLHHQLELLLEHGISRVLLLVAHLGEKIEQYFADGASLGLRLSYSYEAAPLGTGGALNHAADKLEDEFLVLNGDTFLPIDYVAMARDFYKRRPAALIVAYDNRDRRGASNLAIAADGRVTAYRKHDASGLTHIDAGAIMLSRDVLEEIPPGRACSLEQDIFPELIRQGRMRAWVTREPFYDMGTPAGLEALARRLA